MRYIVTLVELPDYSKQTLAACNDMHGAIQVASQLWSFYASYKGFGSAIKNWWIEVYGPDPHKSYISDTICSIGGNDSGQKVF